MGHYTVKYIDYNGEAGVSEFDTLAAASRFIDVCDEVGIPVGMIDIVFDN